MKSSPTVGGDTGYLDVRMVTSDVKLFFGPVLPTGCCETEH